MDMRESLEAGVWVDVSCADRRHWYGAPPYSPNGVCKKCGAICFSVSFHLPAFIFRKILPVPGGRSVLVAGTF